jgi:polyisoprenoid-binding protein YceI
MKIPFLILCIVLAALLAAGCSNANDTDTPSSAGATAPDQPPDAEAAQTLSPEAAAAFAELNQLSLSESGGLRTFIVVAAQSEAAYIVDEELFADATRKFGLAIGKTKVTGVTQDVEGLLQIDMAAQAVGANRFAVYLPTLRTDQGMRDQWIRENALASDSFPLAVFIATEIRGAPQGYKEGDPARFQLEGELTMRGVTMPSVWDVTATLRGDRISGSLETRLRMTDLGFDPPSFANTLTVKDEFSVRISFVALEQ